MQAVILAAGKSTRTFPLTVTRPKQLLTVANKTLFEYTMDAIEGLVDEAIVVVGYKKEMIIERFGNRYKKIKLTYVEQKEQQGTGHALLQAEPHIKDRFLLMYGDDIYSRKDVQSCLKHKYSILSRKVSDPERFGVLETEGKRLIRIVEKPKKFISNLVNNGLYVLDKSVFQLKLNKTERGELEATDYVTELAKKQGVHVETSSDYWFPIGYPWDLLNTNSHFLKLIKREIKGKVEDGVTLKGEIIVGKGTVIKAGSYIEGPVIIGENCIIGPHAYIRPDTSIGNNCKIRSEIFDAIIGDECVLKHYAYVAHSVLGMDVNIGAGTITADYRHDGKNHITVVNEEKVDSLRRKLGSFMGDHVRTAINTSIYPGRKIWPWTGTLPGEIVTKDKKDMSLKS